MTAGCNFLESYDWYSDEKLEEVGLFQGCDYGRYDDFFTDTFFDEDVKAARALAVIACFLVSAALIIMLAMQVLLFLGKEVEKMYTAVGLLLVSALAMQFGTNYKMLRWSYFCFNESTARWCITGTHGNAGLANVGLLCFLSFLFLIMPAPATPLVPTCKRATTTPQPTITTPPPINTPKNPVDVEPAA